MCKAGRTADVPAFGIRALDVAIGDDVLQLASPVDADNPVMRFLERKGEGFYNLALEIDDLDETVRELASQGVRVSEPIELEPGVRSAFVTMAATHGLSVQLVEVVQSVGLSVDQPVSESAGQVRPNRWRVTPSRTSLCRRSRAIAAAAVAGSDAGRVVGRGLTRAPQG